MTENQEIIQLQHDIENWKSLVEFMAQKIDAHERLLNKFEDQIDRLFYFSREDGERIIDMQHQLWPKAFGDYEAIEKIIGSADVSSRKYDKRPPDKKL